MPNLVGIGNSQVPTNAMLGGLAYQDSVGEIDIDKIKAKIPDTAVAIFVYDTRKDSDGGAWRKKATTQSWYNEGASKTRGARKEFPAVAVIVIETYELVIYDGDDPNLPMWMRFEFNQLQSPSANMGRTPFGLGHTNASPHNNLNLSCVHMLNGYLFIGANRSANSNQLQAGYDVNFISEIMHEYLHYPVSASNANKWRLAGKVIDRNSTEMSDSPTLRYDGTGYSIQDMVNDVDMEVLPNAPIDQFSGLPVPTVALATEGGASIIMDDGNVYNTNDSLNWSRVNISEANGRKVLNYIFSGGGTVRHKFIDNITGDFDRDYEDYPHASASTSVASNGNSDVYGHSSGMMIYKRGNDPGNWSNTDFDDSKARVTSSYNTGYMHGDIKLATLSDIVTEKDNVNYALQATQHATGRLTGESYDDGETHFHINDDASSDNGYLAINMNGLTVGQAYKITMTRSAHAHLDSGYDHRVDHNHGTGGQTYFYHWDNNTSSSHVVTGVFVATTSGDDDLVIYTNGAYIEISNFRIEETDDVGGTNLVTNGDFSNGTSGWTAHNASISAGSGVLTVSDSSNAGADSQAYRTVTGLSIGKVYNVGVRHKSNTQHRLWIGTGSGPLNSGTQNVLSHTYNSSYATSYKNDYYTFTATTTSVTVALQVDGTGTAYYNWIYINQSVEDDHSGSNGYGNGNPFQVFGTITKEPVATGAELLSYGPFTTSNRLRQLQNSDINFENGSFYIMLWFNNSGTNIHQTLVSRDDRELDISILADDTYNRRFRIYAFNSSNSMSYLDSGNDPFLPNTWNHLCVNFTGGNTCSIYVNGKLNNTGSLSYDIDDTSHGLNIGARNTSGSYAHAATGTKLALIRIGGNAPSSEQIKNIYNEERDLYNENAKCTLHGTSSNIKALAFDDSNGVLHAGTSAGRSEFQGLSRINNTTTAVTTAISASNELVVEQ